MIKSCKNIIKTSLMAGMMLLVSCQQNGVFRVISPNAVSNSRYIEFGNYVNSATRASKHTGTGSFVVGDTMAVWGEQKTDTIVDVVFNNQDVRFVESSKWTYDNKKLWNIGSIYTFYGFFPYSKTLYAMSSDRNRYITIPEYTTPDNPDDQIDLMISERRVFNEFVVVDMIFHHILSNVNIYVKLSNTLSTSGIDSVTLISIKLNNVMSTGHYEQTGWRQERAVGEWTDVRNYMEIPAVTNVKITKEPTAVFHDYLMIPQKLFSIESQPKDITVDATFRIVYKDGTTSTHIKKGIRLAGITGRNGSTSTVLTQWDPNSRYDYTLSFNPQVSTRIWESDGDGSLKIDPATGDTLTTDDDTPYPGKMRYNPDEPDIVYVLEDTDGDTIPDTWKTYPVAWEDVDEDGLLEVGIDRDGDGHIDNVDGDVDTQQVPGGDPDKDPTDGNPKNPKGKDVIIVHYDSDGDGDIDDDDEWIQVQKDPVTGVITPSKEQENATIEFTATIREWEQKFTVDYVDAF